MVWVLTCMMAIPLIFAPRTFFNGFALPQTLALGTLSTLGVLLGLASGAYVSTSLPSIFSLLFIACLVVSFLKSEPIHNGRKEIGLQFPLVLTFLLFVSFLTPENLKWPILASAIGTILCSIYSHIQTLGVDPFFPNKLKGGGAVTNAIGTVGNPNFLASYLCIAVWFLVYSALEFDSTLFLFVGFTAFVLIKTRSRAGLFGFLGSVWFFILVCAYYGQLFFYDDLVSYGGVIVSCIAVVATITLFKVYWKTFFYKPVDPKGDQVWYASFRYRLCYWICALKLFKAKPIFGWGLWSFRREIYNTQADIHNEDGEFLKPDRYLTPQPREVHNDYLEHLVEFGVVGTLIFLCFLGSVYYVGFKFLGTSTGLEFFKMLTLLAGLTAIAVDAIWFFALRLPSTGILFWGICGLIVVKAQLLGNSILLSTNIFLVFLVGLLLAGFLWECVIKRCAASYHLLRSRVIQDSKKRMEHLVKSILWAPNDTIARTHACMAALEHDPTIANIHAWKIVEHYDGMTPLNAALFNVGLAVSKTQNIYDHAEMFLKKSHYLLPSFAPPLTLLNGTDGIGVRTRYKGGRAVMRISDEGTLWRVRALLGEVERCDLNLQLHNMRKVQVNLEEQNLSTQKQLAISQLERSLLQERKRLNVPDNWPFDPEKGTFLDPQEMSEEQRKKFGIKMG